MVAALEMGHVMRIVQVLRGMSIAMLLVSAMNAAHAKHYELIAGGIGGEAEYEQRFREQANQLAKAVQHASSDAQVTLLIGEKATRAAIRATLNEWSPLSNDDQVVITLIGHGTFDGEEYRFNVPGQDVTANDLREWLQPLQSKQLIVLATSASGGALAKLQSEKRIVITATKSGGERNATRFAEHWVQALSASEADRDKNEWVTAQEAFDFAVRKVADAYKSSASLATEHARLEGKRAEAMALGRLGSLKEMPNDAELNQLFAERLRIENDFEAVKSRKSAMDVDAYYTELEKTLIALAKTQKRIDSRQATLSKGVGR
jgi:Peptidase C13 family